MIHVFLVQILFWGLCNIIVAKLHSYPLLYRGRQAGMLCLNGRGGLGGLGLMADGML
jgi:hypothetical protein